MTVAKGSMRRDPAFWATVIGALFMALCVGIVFGAEQAPPAITNYAATGVTDWDAWCQGNLTSTGGLPTVTFLHYGTNDAASVRTNWQYEACIGTNAAGAVSNRLTHLTGGYPYWYRFSASNQIAHVYAAPGIVFTTAPAVVTAPFQRVLWYGYFNDTNSIGSTTPVWRYPPPEIGVYLFGYSNGVARTWVSEGYSPDDWTLSTQTSGGAVLPLGQAISITKHEFQDSWILSNTVWDDLSVSAGLQRTGAAQPALDVFRDAVRLYTYESGDESFFTTQLPHRYKAGTNLRPHVHWTHKQASPSGDVAWMLEYTIAPYGSGSYAATVTAGITQAVDSVSQYEQAYAGLPEIDGTDLAESSCIVGRLYRGANVGSDVMLVEFDFHFEAEKPGSDDETP